MSFDDLGLSPKVLSAVKTAGYESPTEIQANAIPPALAGRDVLGIAQTGTGKTAAFTLPMLTRLERGRARARMPRSLVLEPTRELAAQVAEALDTYGKNHKLNIALLIGGVSFAEQDRKLDRGADVLIATPGRLLDHFERGKLMMSGVELLVVDEADRMLDMGFIPDIERIFKLTPFTRQTLFFSATMPPEIQRLTETFLHTPERIEVAKPSTTAETIEQRLIAAPRDAKDKRAALRDLLRDTDVSNAIIFCNRKSDVRILHRSLEKHGFNAGAIHGDMDQHARMDTLDRFRSGTLTYLVASDVAARGLDIPAVSHVINFDVPIHAEDYVHRIGRTGRAGRLGVAFSLVTPPDRKNVDAIKSLIGKDIEWQGEAVSNGSASGSSSGRKPRNERRRKSDAGASEQKATAAVSDINPASEVSSGASKPDRGAVSAKKPKSKRTDRRERNEDPVFAETAFVPDFLLRPVSSAAKS